MSYSDAIAHSHAPAHYVCPFCCVARGNTDARVLSRPDDVFYRTDQTLGLIAPHWWLRNPGSALVVPTRHVETLYDLSPTSTATLFRAVQEVATAMKRTYGCDGVTVRQNNEPAGGQSVWHVHVHVVPRYRSDLWKVAWKRPVTPARRRPFVAKLQRYFTELT